MYDTIRALGLATAVFFAATFTSVAQDKTGRPTAAATQSFPGGATSITEEHRDWTVTCAMRNAAKECFFSQVLGRRQAGERVLTIELRAPKHGNVKGMIFAPFGLLLSKGATLVLDEAEFASGLPFTMCTEQGCIVPVDFDEKATAMLSSGKALQFSAASGTTAEAFDVTLSLDGFSSAMARSVDLER